MSVTVTTLGKRFGGELDIDSGETRITEEWWLIADSDTATEAEVYDASALPTVQVDTHPEVGYLVADSVRLRQNQDAPQAWLAIVGWKNIETGSIDLSTLEVARDPVDRTVITGYQTYNYMDTPNRDVKGKPFVNSAGSLIQPAPQRYVGATRLTCSRFERFFTRSKIEAYNNKANASPFYGWEAGRVLCQIPNSPLIWINGEWFADVTYEFLVKPFSDNDSEAAEDRFWTPERIANFGYQQKVDCNGTPKLEHIMIREQGTCENPGARSIPTPDPLPLDEDGAWVGEEYDPEEDTTYEEFDKYELAELNNLNLRLNEFYPGFFD